jgi:tetratricopeptide (TPR) repeat protein
MVGLSAKDAAVLADGPRDRPAGRVTGQDAPASYDAFISYSHALDKPIAAALQSVIQTLGKPWWRRRVSRVFRDDTSLSASPGLWPSIEEALTSSRFLVLLASPEAAKSKWVAREVARWLECKGPDALLIALTAGELIWDEDSSDFRRTAVPPLPVVLQGRFKNEPLWIDLRDARAAGQVLGKANQVFLSSCASIIAAIRNLPKEDILSEEVTQQRRNLMWARGAVLTLLILTAAAIWQANRATVAQHLAEAQRDRAQRALNQVVATADRRVLTLSLRLQEDASRGRHDEHPPEPIVTPVPGREGDDHAISDAQEQTGRAATLLTKGDGTGALKSAEAAVAILEAGADSTSRNVAWQLARLGAYDRVAEVAMQVGNTPRATAALSRGVDLAGKLVKEDADDLRWQQGLAAFHEEIGDLALKTKDFGEAESHYGFALELRTKIARMSGTSLEARREQAIASARFGNLLMDQKNPEQAFQR